MKAACWCGTTNVRLLEVPEPRIVNPHDAVIRVTTTTICGSDTHLYDGVVPSMKRGDILGHEPVGVVEDIGSKVTQLKKGDRVGVISIIACGQCWYCKRGEFSFCDNTNPNAGMLAKLYGLSCAGILGYSHLFGGYAGGQAQYLRVPFADVNCFKVPEEISNEQALAMTDAFPTGFYAAENCQLQGGETVAVWGCGPVGQFAIKCARILGAGKILAIDSISERLELAANVSGAIPIDFDHDDVFDRVMQLTGGRGADCCIDAVGMESHGTTVMSDLYDRVKQNTGLVNDRIHVLRAMIEACRKGGILSVVGVYAMFSDKFPFGAAFNKGLRFMTGQQPGQRYVERMIELTRKKSIDPAFVFTHRYPLDQISHAYDTFVNRRDGIVKCVISC